MVQLDFTQRPHTPTHGAVLFAPGILFLCCPARAFSFPRRIAQILSPTPVLYTLDYLDMGTASQPWAVTLGYGYVWCVTLDDGLVQIRFSREEISCNVKKARLMTDASRRDLSADRDCRVTSTVQ